MDQRLWLLFQCLKDGDDWYRRDFDVMVVAAIMVEVPVIEDVRSTGIVMVMVVGLRSMWEIINYDVFQGKNSFDEKNDQKIQIKYIDKYYIGNLVFYLDKIHLTILFSI